MVRVHAAGADEVVEHHAVVAGQVRQHAAPRRLVRPEPVRQHHNALAAAHHAHVQDLQKLRPARRAAADHLLLGAGRRGRAAAAGAAGAERVRGSKHMRRTAGSRRRAALYILLLAGSSGGHGLFLPLFLYPGDLYLLYPPSSALFPSLCSALLC